MSELPPVIYATPDGHWHARMPRTTYYAYRLIVDAERSAASHRHYMAAVHEAWMQLPEHLALAFPTADHLRRYALIKTGFCTIKKVVGRNVAVNGYAIIVNEDGVTTVYEAKSQSYQAMGKAEFAKSKQAVLDLLAQMVGVTSEQLSDNAGRAA